MTANRKLAASPSQSRPGSRCSLAPRTCAASPRPMYQNFQLCVFSFFFAPWRPRHVEPPCGFHCFCFAFLGKGWCLRNVLTCKKTQFLFDTSHQKQEFYTPKQKQFCWLLSKIFCLTIFLKGSAHVSKYFKSLAHS